ncbi:MAG: hypothetical protein SGARI_006637, partial [Bacillariaceae sp.]
MRKMGVGLAQVQQLAFVEAKLTPEQLEELMKANEDENKKSMQLGVVTVPSPHMAKYLRMQKAGLPLPAIQKAAEIDGNIVGNMELMHGLGLVESVQVDESFDGVGDDDNNSNNSSANYNQNNSYFEVVGLNKVALDGNSDLASLVRKMAQSVDKTSRRIVAGSSGSSSTKMTVDVLTLYHALG